MSQVKSKETLVFENKKAVEKFINLKEKENTKQLYLYRLKKYFDCIGKDPDNYIKSNQDCKIDKTSSLTI